MTEFDSLICPVCSSPLSLREDGRGLCCGGAKKHNFDISRHGHVNFAGGGYDSNSGDPVDMVRARVEFLEAGWFSPLAEEIVSLCGDGCGVLVDAGCGNGYYGAQAAKKAKRLYGFDLSKHAVEYAARKARREGCENCLFAVGSVYRMPIADACADAVLSVFAPIAEAEFERILKPSGRLIIAAAAPDHLKEMKACLYENVTENGERGDLPQNMSFVERRRVSYRRTLDNAAIGALYTMTPYSRRTAKEAADALLARNGLEVTFSFDVFVYEKKEKI